MGIVVMLLLESECPKQLVNVKVREGKSQCCGGQAVIPGARTDPGPRDLESHSIHLHYCGETMLLLCSPECGSLRHSALQIFLLYSPFLSQFPPPFLNFVFPLQGRVGSSPGARGKSCFSIQNPALPEQLLGNRSTVTHIAVQDNTIN